MTKQYANLQKAFDGSANTSPLIHLSTEEATALVDLMVDQSKILDKVRLVKMDSARMNIGRILSGGRFLKPGGKNVEITDNKKYEAPTDTIEIVTKSFIGAIDVHDSEIKHSIEGAGIESTMIGHVAKKLRNEIEELLLYSDTAATVAAGDEALKVTDGVFKRLTGSAGVVDFSVAAQFPDQFASTDKFRKMLKTMPVQYRNNAEFFLHNDVMIDYNSLFDNNVNRDEFVSKILTKTTNEVPLFAYDTGGLSKILLTDPQNIILGIQIEDAAMQFEKERVASKRKTTYHFSIDMDFQIEIPEAAVIGDKIKTK